MPPVAKSRAPYRSDSTPEMGPAIEEPDRQRQHVDAGPQRRAGEVVAVQRQPDALEPDDQHEHETAAADRDRKLASVPAVNARIRKRGSRNMGSAVLISMMAKMSQEQDADAELADRRRAGPAHGVVAVGLDPVGDADHESDQTRPRR